MEMILEFESSHQNKQPGGLNDLLTNFIYSISDYIRTNSGNIDLLFLMNLLLPSLQEKSPADIGEIHNIPPIKIQLNLSKSLARINQYLRTKEALQVIKPTIEDHKAQGLITSHTLP